MGKESNNIILVTGGTGLLGGHLLYELLQRNVSVRALFRSEKSLQKTRQLFACYTKNPDQYIERIEWVQADITDFYSLNAAFEGVTAVFHCAATVSFNPADYPKLLVNNIEGTRNMVNLSLRQKEIWFCHVSSVAAIGMQQQGGFVTEENEFNFSEKSSGYSLSKFYAETEVWRGIEEGLRACIVNPAVIIGPGIWNEGSGEMFSRVYQGLKFYTEGTTGFVDVRDVVAIMIELYERELCNERFILSENNYSFRQIFGEIAANLQVKEPSIKAGPVLTQLAWRMEKIRSLLTGKTPIITRESLLSAFKTTMYSNQKIIEALNYKFIPVTHSIKHTASLFPVGQSQKTRQITG